MWPVWVQKRKANAMIVIEIEKKERGKYRIVTDEDITIYLYYKELKALALEINREITEANWAKAMSILLARGKKRVFHLLARQDYTRYYITKKLRKDGYRDCLIEEIITYFEDKGFIDDLRFVEKYYAYYKEQKKSACY